jgi:hypothetical protein
MINQTDLIHDVLSLSDNFTIMTTNNEALEPECKHDVLAFQWFACDDKEQLESPVAELIGRYMGNTWLAFRAV